MHARLRILTSLFMMVFVLTAVAQPKKSKLPEPEQLSLLTKDGVILKATYFASSKGKEAAPVIILHDWEQRGSNYTMLAKGLQMVGRAVIVPDLRGHGGSTQRRTRNPGETEEIDIERMNKRDMNVMYLDVEACKKHLMKENNEGKLNIEKLCIVGNGFGSLLAANFALFDWSAQQLPNYKMGRDVNGLVFVSPVSSYKGYTAANALKNQYVRSRISVQIIADGNDSKAVNEAKRLHKKLERFHAPVPEDMEERIKKQDLFLVTVGMAPSGIGAGDRRNANAWKAVDQFIKLRLDNQPFEWRERKSPLGD